MKKPRDSLREAAPPSIGCHRAAGSAAAARMQEGVCSVTGTLPCSRRKELLCLREYVLCFLLYEVTGPKAHPVLQMGGRCSFAWGRLSLWEAGVSSCNILPLL